MPICLPFLEQDPSGLGWIRDHLDALYHNQLGQQMLAVKFLASLGLFL